MFVGGGAKKATNAHTKDTVLSDWVHTLPAPGHAALHPSSLKALPSSLIDELGALFFVEKRDQEREQNARRGKEGHEHDATYARED